MHFLITFVKSLKYLLMKSILRFTIFLLTFSIKLFVQGQDVIVDSSLIYIKEGAQHFYSGEFSKTEEDWKKALEMRLKYHENNSVSIGHAYNNLGVLYLNTWDFNNAEHYLTKAKKIYTDNNENVYESNVNSNLGANQRLKGNQVLAEEYFIIALDIIKNINTPEANQRKSEILNRLGMLEISLTNYKKASQYYKYALNQYQNSIPDFVMQNLYENLAKCYIHLDNDSTKIILDNALLLAQDVKFSNKSFVSNIYQLYAKFYESKNNRDKAFYYLKKSEDVLKFSEVDSTLIFNLYNNIIDFYYHFKEYDSSLYYIQQSLQYLSKNTNTTIPNKYINPILGIEILRKKSDVLIKLYQQRGDNKFLKGAIIAMLEASELVDQSRKSFLSIESKLALAENESAIYQTGIYASTKMFEVTNDKKYLEQAFQFSEKSKSSVLEGTLQEQKAKTFGGIPDSLLVHEEEYKRNIAFYKELLHNEKSKIKPDTIKIKTFQSTLFDFTEKNEKLKNKLEELYPNYYELKYSSSETSLADLQKELNSKTTVLEYTLTDSNLYIFQIDNKSVELFTFHVDDDFYSLLVDFLQEFKSFHFFNQDNNIYSNYEQKAYSVYQKLIGSSNPDNIKKNIIIIPDNILSYLPFEAIVRSKKEKSPVSYTEIDYLNNHHAISYSYSANLLLETSKNNKLNWINHALAVAPNYGETKNENSAVNQNMLSNQRNALKPLPFAKEEAELISKLTSGMQLIGIEATEESFLQASPDYQILHLAMHTLIDDKNPLFSKLVFSSDSLDSGFLTTNEIFSLKLNAKMTVLSACSSGEGELNKGEGVLSLARSFFYAGCPSLVMTLWNVDDNAGLTLMHQYYKYLKKGYSKPDAMQKAKVSYLNKVPPEKQHPYYWANYICIGNPSALYINKWNYLWLIITTIAIFIITLSVIKKRKKSLLLTEPDLNNLDPPL